MGGSRIVRRVFARGFGAIGERTLRRFGLTTERGGGLKSGSEKYESTGGAIGLKWRELARRGVSETDLKEPLTLLLGMPCEAAGSLVGPVKYVATRRAKLTTKTTLSHWRLCGYARSITQSGTGDMRINIPF